MMPLELTSAHLLRRIHNSMKTQLNLGNFTSPNVTIFKAMVYTKEKISTVADGNSKINTESSETKNLTHLIKKSKLKS
jgi:hypothetical protein